MDDVFDWLPIERFGRPSGCNWLYVPVWPEFRRYGRDAPVLEWNMLYFKEDF